MGTRPFRTSTTESTDLAAGVPSVLPGNNGWNTENADTFAIDVIPQGADQVDTIMVERAQHGAQFVPDQGVNTALAAAAPFTSAAPASIEYPRPPGEQVRVTLTSVEGASGVVVNTRQTGFLAERPAR